MEKKLNGILFHLLKAMKFSLYIFTLLAIMTSTLMARVSNAQQLNEVRASLSLKEVRLDKALEQLQKTTPFSFMYNSNAIHAERLVSINANNKTVKEILEQLFKNTQITYRQVKQEVYFEKKADPGKVKGVVTDAQTGETLIGVSIFVKGTGVSFQTNANGEFEFPLAAGKYEMEFRYIGYDSRTVSGVEIKERQTTTVNTSLTAGKGQLNEVVVLGFGQTQMKVAQTGAITSISTKEIKQSPVANLANALVGRLPGLIAVQRSGEPGADAPELYIRGLATTNSNAPLITIDGIQKDAQAISLLDPNEVESVTILKDASATALYGIKGANGVIIIQTRRGKEGAAAVNASVQTAVQSATRLPEYLDSYNYALLKNEAIKNENPAAAPMYSQEVLEAYRTGSDPYKYPNVNWLKEMIKPAPMTRADFNISGGTRQVKYFVNVGYTQQGGLYNAEKNPKYDPNINYKRYNFRSNTDIDFDKNFSMSLSLFGSIEDKNSSRTSTAEMFTWLLQTTPNAFPVKYPNGLYGGSRVNPFVLLNENGYIQNFDSSLSGMLSATRKLDFITKGLFLKANYSFDGYFRNDFVRTKTVETGLYNGTGDYFDRASYTIDGITSPLSAPTSTYDQRRNVWIDVSMNYARSFGDHSVTGLLLANRTQRVEFADIPYVQQGLVSRLTYGYKYRYFAEINMGYNGSDNFAKEKRYGLFPALSAGWVISEESFLKGSKTVDLLKVRGSYGLTGNDMLGGRRWLFVSEFGNGTGYGYGDPITNIGGKTEGPMANADVTWEKARKLNIGLELKLWKDMLGLNVDVFREKRNDILISRQTVPGIIGVTGSNLTPVNMGIVVNRGIEAELMHRKRIGDVTYFIKANGSFARNKLLFWDEVNQPYAYRRRTGQPLRQMFGLTAIGFFKNQDDIRNSPVQFGNVIPGDIKYQDLNGDGKIDSNDEGPIGKSSVPELLYGFAGGLNWKNFDFSFLFQGAGNYNVNFSHASAWEFYNGASVLKHHLGRWTPETSETATYPVLHTGLNNNNHREGTSFFMKDASYVRLKNVELGYTFTNVHLTKKTGLKTLRVYANGMNLYTWDKMGNSYFDPEAPSGKGFFYPQLRVINFGLSTDF